VDGPVFRGELVRWDDIGTIPFDAFGAPGWERRLRPASGRAATPAAGDGAGPAEPPRSPRAGHG
jgi:dihydroorotate dehydrogenase electron transfer subunit